jgi:hypothetical protein
MFGKKKKKALAQTLPREMAEIQKEYGTISSQYANASYQASLYTEEATRLFKVMQDLNNEASERNKLDSQRRADEAAATPASADLANEAANAG